jgi:hypothetical protein
MAGVATIGRGIRPIPGAVLRLRPLLPPGAAPAGTATVIPARAPACRGPDRRGDAATGSMTQT